MLKRIFVLGVGALLAAGCGGSAKTICDKVKDCIDDELDVEKCQDDINDDINDKKYESKDVGKCADCLDNNSCSEIEKGDCNELCGGIAIRSGSSSSSSNGKGN